MHKINDLVLYSTHGLCKIHDITEKTFSDETKAYYELRPLRDLKLQIHIPVGSTKIQMMDLLNEKQANAIIDSFEHATYQTFEKNYFVNHDFNEMISTANREKMVTVIYSLMIRKDQVVKDGKKLPIQETKALANLQGILFNELAIVTNRSYEDIYSDVEKQVFQTA